MKPQPAPLSAAQLATQGKIAPALGRILTRYVRLLWIMTKKAPAFWAGCFFGAMVAEFPKIAEAAIRFALARL